jgi:hypothetical protein
MDKEERISITTVQDQFLSFAIFLTPLVSHWSLPLSLQQKSVQRRSHDLRF